jgi:hypothetical protein
MTALTKTILTLKVEKWDGHQRGDRDQERHQREIARLRTALKEIAENSHDVEACVFAREALRTPK